MSTTPQPLVPSLPLAAVKKLDRVIQQLRNELPDDRVRELLQDALNDIDANGDLGGWFDREQCPSIPADQIQAGWRIEIHNQGSPIEAKLSFTIEQVDVTEEIGQALVTVLGNRHTWSFPTVNKVYVMDHAGTWRRVVNPGEEPAEIRAPELVAIDEVARGWDIKLQGGDGGRITDIHRSVLNRAQCWKVATARASFWHPRGKINILCEEGLFARSSSSNPWRKVVPEVESRDAAKH